MKRYIKYTKLRSIFWRIISLSCSVYDCCSRLTVENVYVCHDSLEAYSRWFEKYRWPTANFSASKKTLVGEWRDNDENAMYITLLYYCILPSLDTGLDTQSLITAVLCFFEADFERLPSVHTGLVSKLLTCHLLDATKLHLIKIIMSACMISVSLHLTWHADGFVTVFFP